VLANPSFDFQRDDLHGALHIDRAIRPARRLDRFGQFHAITAFRAANDTNAVNGAIEVPGETRYHGICQAGAPEELNLHAVLVELIDQHRNVPSLLQLPGNPYRRARTGRNERAHAPAAHPDNGVCSSATVGRPKNHDGVEAKCLRRNRREFPIGKVRGKNEGGLAIVANTMNARDILGLTALIVVSHSTRRRARIVKIPYPIEVRHLGSHPAEVTPNAAQNLLDLEIGLFRKSGTQVVTADAMLGQPRPHPLQQPTERTGNTVDGDQAAYFEQSDREPACEGIESPTHHGHETAA
jgi:hypothetical protein